MIPRRQPDGRAFMSWQFFNTLHRRVEPFVPGDPEGREVRLYCCGPTVHDFAHIGNFRTFVCVDFLRRCLEDAGYQVIHVMNVTDVEDKIIRRVRETGTSLAEYTRRYETAFLEDHRTLNCLPPQHLPRATEHVADILVLIERLLSRSLAYRTPDGSVYFSIAKYREAGHQYGQLLTLDLEALRPGERTDADEYGKEAATDFALWKARVPEDGEVFWPSPWGEGRPGWHIECSAMSMKLLGASFDLHLGGEDLIFPHHEDEIAQSEGACLHGPGQRFVRYWLHVAFLLVEGRKMSKSAGNFFTLRDLLGRGYTGREIRFLLLSSHYRESFNFTLDGLSGARTALARLDECGTRLKERAGDAVGTADPTLLDRVRAALQDDLNVSRAWGALFEWVRDRNRELAENRLSPEAAASAWAAWDAVLRLFGVEPAATTATIPAEVLALAEERLAARKARDFARSDVLRNELKSRGWLVEDTPNGPKLKAVDG